MNLPEIRLGEWVEAFVEWVTVSFSGVFAFLTTVIEGLLDWIVDILSFGPPLLLILLISLLATYTSRWQLGVFSLLGLWLIYHLGYWEASIQTIAIVLLAGLLTIVIGIPIGIWCAQRNLVRNIVTPILDFMQTMPAFVYLIPAILFFGIGVVPGIIASFIFAIAPTIRMTNLGIREVPKELIEAADAFGSNKTQKLIKVQIPLAMPTIMAGVNQSMMLALSMVVTASLVGAPGLGAEVYRAVSQIDIGTGFEAGLSIVIIAIILDRITQNLRDPAYKKLVKPKVVYIALIALILIFAIVLAVQKEEKVPAENQSKIGEETDYTIIGIEPGAGIMAQTDRAIKDYGLEGWKVKEGSSAAMAAELKKAYDAKKPIIITGWSPHWLFADFELKFLDDPKESYGKIENVHTIVRKGLEKDLPGAYKILDQFYWDPSDMESVMVDLSKGMDAKEAAEKWIQANPEKVAKWKEGARRGNGESIKLVYVAWETEIASTNVIAQVLEQHGYQVTISQVEIGAMYAGVANGSADAMVGAWLPSGQKEYYETYKNDFIDLGPNLKGTRNGLVVPKYVDIDSIEDLR